MTDKLDKIFSKVAETREIVIELKTELPHLATKVDVISAVNDHYKSCRKSFIPKPARDNHLIAKLVGAVIALTGAVVALTQWVM